MSGRVLIVGGGISGLATAYRLVTGEQQVAEVTVLESAETPGGKMHSVEVGGISLEAGPDSLLARKPWGVELCRELGLEDELLPPATGSTQIWSDGGLLPFPSGPFGISTHPIELWRWPGMSTRGKLRASGDLWRKAGKGTADESLGSLLRRRIGDEACDKLVAPLLGGLFAGDIDRLSVQATFPELAAWERSYGSLIRGARAASKASKASKASQEDSQGKKPPPMFLRLRGGFRRLTDELAGAIGAERLSCGKRVESIRRRRGGFVVRVDEDDVAADCVVFTSPAFVTADLLGELAPEAATELRQIPYMSTAAVLLVYAEGTGSSLPHSSGFVVPRGKARMTAATLVSRKWPDEAFGDRAVVRCFVGRAGSEDLLERPDEEMVEDVCRQLSGVLPLPALPEAARVVRWPSAMPQYEVGHLDRVARIEEKLPPGVFVVGQAYRGAGIPDCVRAAGEVAARVRSHLAGGAEREAVG